MGITKCSCPACGVTLKLATPVAAGKTIKCPKCQESFRVPAEEPVSARPQPAAKKIAPPPEEDEAEEPDEDRPRLKKNAKKPKKKQKMNPVLMWSVVGGVVAVLAVAGVFVALSLFGDKGSPTASKPGDKPGDKPGGPGRPGPSGTIELSNPEAAIVLKEVRGREIFCVHWKVKYRFTQGQFDPNQSYAYMIDFGQRDIQKIHQHEMKAEGVLEQTTPIFLGEFPKEIKIKVMQGPSDNRYDHTIGKEVSCAVKPYADAPAEIVKTTPEQEAVVKRLTALGGRVSRSGEQADGAPTGTVLIGKKLTDADLAEIKKLIHLQQLSMAGNEITDAGLAHLKDMKALRLLYMDDNPKITDAGIAHLKGLTKLHQITFSNTGTTDAALAHLKEMKALGLISVGGKKVGDAGLVHLQALTELRSLSLAESPITDRGLVHLKGLTNLEILELDDTQVTDAGLVHLKGLTNLKTLRLGGTKVTDEGVRELQKSLPDTKIGR